MWRPQRDSNPCFGLERATSWASGRWGRTVSTERDRAALRTLHHSTHVRERRRAARPVDACVREELQNQVGLYFGAAGATASPFVGARCRRCPRRHWRATCGAALAMFVGALREETMAALLFGLFGLAVVCALCAIVAFTVEMLLAGTGIRAEVA